MTDWEEIKLMAGYIGAGLLFIWGYITGYIDKKREVEEQDDPYEFERLEE